MGREIKFRAWDKDKKRMSRPFGLAEIYSPHETITAGGLYFDRESDFIPMQFTGLHDKNGKEIYEGDIVRFNTELRIGLTREVRFDNESRLLPFYDDEFIQDEQGDWFEFSKAGESIFEVIGNIYENPELLGDK